MLVHLGIHMPVHHEQVKPTVVVVVDEAVAPAHKGNGDLRDPRSVAHVGKAGVPIVVIEHLVVVAEVGHEKIHQPIVFVIPRGNAH